MATGDDYIPLRDFGSGGGGSGSSDDESAETSRQNASSSKRAKSTPLSSSPPTAGSESSATGLTPRRFRGQTIVAHSTSTSKLSTLVDNSRNTLGLSQASSRSSSPRARNADHRSRSPQTRNATASSRLATFEATAADNDGGSSTRAGSSFDSILNDYGAEEELLDNEATANERAQQQQQQQQHGGASALGRLFGASAGSEYLPLGGHAEAGRRRRRAAQSEPIWERRMLVLPAVMLLSMGLLAAVISSIAWIRHRAEHPPLHVNTHLFPYLVDRSTLGSGQYSVRLIHTNDLHARFTPYDSQGEACDPKNTTARCVGGAAYIKTAIDHLRLADGVQGERNTMLLNAGDELQGSLFHVLFRGNVSADLLNAYRPDALTLGNHEFDLGAHHLARYLGKVHAPAICANLEYPADGSLADLQASLQPFTIVDRHKVGVIGVLTPETMASSVMDGVKITDPVPAINAMRAKLNKMGIHRVVVLSHLGYEADMDMAKRVDSGVSLIVGGHTHSYLRSTEGGDALGPSDGTPSKGSYPTWIRNGADGDWQTAVVQAKSYGEYVGYLDLVFNDDGSLDSRLTRGAPVSVDVASPQSPLHGAQPNERILDIMRPYVEQAEQFASKRIGQATAEFAKPAGNFDVAETALGDLVADALVWATRQHARQGAVTIVGTGSMRARLPKGDITRGHLLSALPFDDRLAAVSVTGSQLRAMVAATTGDPQKQSVLTTLQASGLRYDQTGGDIHVRTHVDNIDARPMVGEKWDALQNDRTYEVLAPWFLVSGGDGIFPEDMTSKARVVFESYRDWVELYITRFSPVSPTLDQRK
ncbi:hypothetical protein GGI07_005334 [Coemansia sp. Benny D115]|nr:hypothetical protein GGI07_005334 [Coemansia sp. Benny D115]